MRGSKAIGINLGPSGEEKSPGLGHVPALDGVRGFAAATVFVLHYGGGARSSSTPLRLIGAATHFGWAGVSLFFVLSGFLISGILWDSFDKPNWWRRFYIRRSLRIFPLYYFALLLALIVWSVSEAAHDQLQGLWVYALYLSNVPVFEAQLARLPESIPFAHFWSLAVEEQFYLVWPFVLAAFAGRRRSAIRMVAGLWMLSLVFRLTMWAVAAPVKWQTEFLLGRAGELLAGALVALMVRGSVDGLRRFLRILPSTLGISIALLLLVFYVSGDTVLQTPLMSTVGLALTSICAASVVGLCLRPGMMQSAFMFGPLRWLGKISYGFYVYHLMLRNLLMSLTFKIAPEISQNARFGLLFALGLVISLGVASISFYTFEAFFLRLKDRISH